MTISLKGCLSGMEIKSTNSKRPGCTHCQLHFNTRQANCMLCLLSGCIIKANLYWLDEFMLKLTINSCFVLYLYKKHVYLILSHDVASGSDITLCNKICKPLVVYRLTGNVMTSITALRT